MEDIFKEFFEKSISPLAISAGPQYAFVFVNEAWVQLFGFTKDETLGRNSYELGINPNAYARSHTIDQINNSGSLKGMKLELFSKSGRKIHVVNDITKLEKDSKVYILSSLHDISEFRLAAEARKQEDASLLESLTPRELDIIKLVVRGHGNKDIGKILGISYRTVEVHRAHCIEKLGTKSLLNIKRISEAGNI